MQMNIIGKSECTAYQMAQYLIAKNPNAKSWALEYAQIYLEEGETEGIRGDGAWIQSCKETHYFIFDCGTSVTFDQNNFCGLGVTKKGMKGHSFATPRLGIRAQMQHLKGYATSAPLKNPCVDPRYKYVQKGCACTFEMLAGKWACPGYDTSKASSLQDAMNKGIGYGFDIIKGVELMKQIKTNNQGGTTKMKIAIDAGHGSQTAGKKTPDEYREHWINVKTAYYCEQYLKSKGVETVRIGWNDTNSNDDADIPLSTRQQQIKNAKCDYSVSCHANAFGNGTTYNSANGVETLISNNSSYQKDSLKFAQCIQNRLIQGTKQTNRGVKQQSLAMCNCVAMGTKASCLVEIGFMTNKVEADLMKTEEFCKEQGEDIAKGICDYLGINVTSTSNPIKPSSSTSNNSIYIAKFTPLKGNPKDFAEIIKNIKIALNTDYGLKFTVDSSVNDILLINLGNVVLSTTSYKKNITYVLQQLLKWWGYNIAIDGVFGSGTKSIIEQFQSQVGITKTGTTTKEFWKKILGK